MLDFAASRNRMVEVQLARRGIRDPRVLDAVQQLAGAVGGGVVHDYDLEVVVPLSEDRVDRRGDVFLAVADRDADGHRGG